MKREIEHVRGSGNVFADLGTANPEQALAKAELARQINKIIADRNLTQSEAADVLGIDQPRVSALSNGRLSLFSLEKMMHFASRLGNEVEISVKPALQGRIKVASAGDLNAQGPEHHVLSTAVFEGQGIELSFFLDQQQFDRKTPIRMERVEMGVSMPEAADTLVAA
jgi:predicted XRE-type DNA-binding protein